MSLYDSNIKLLPRPPRDFFSIGNEATRATLPNFSNVTELSQFTHRLFHYRTGISSLGTQATIALCYIFIVIISVNFVLGKFWLVRVIRRPSGIIVVVSNYLYIEICADSQELFFQPNPIVALLLMAGLFGSICFPFFMVLCRNLKKVDGPTPNIVLWFTLPWLLLAFGIVWATIGTYFASPDAFTPSLDNDDTSRIASLKRAFRRANVINSLTLLVPVAMTIGVTIPSFISHRYWEQALQMERQWQFDYPTSLMFNTEMVQGSQIIWYTVLKGARWMAIVFVLYTIIAFAILFAYVPINVRLIMAVHEDLRRNKRQADAIQTIQEEPTIRVSKIIMDALQANQARPSSSSSSITASRHLHFNHTPSPFAFQSYSITIGLFTTSCV
jgi:hypothetical protein